MSKEQQEDFECPPSIIVPMAVSAHVPALALQCHQGPLPALGTPAWPGGAIPLHPAAQKCSLVPLLKASPLPVFFREDLFALAGISSPARLVEKTKSQ